MAFRASAPGTRSVDVGQNRVLRSAVLIVAPQVVGLGMMIWAAGPLFGALEVESDAWGGGIVGLFFWTLAAVLGFAAGMCAAIVVAYRHAPAGHRVGAFFYTATWFLGSMVIYAFDALDGSLVPSLGIVAFWLSVSCAAVWFCPDFAPEPASTIVDSSLPPPPRPPPPVPVTASQ